VVLSSGEEYEVEQILDSRVRRRQLQYLVMWKDYPISEATWEPFSHLQTAPDVIHNFHQRYVEYGYLMAVFTLSICGRVLRDKLNIGSQHRLGEPWDRSV
jgi:hypothetical protein